MKPYIITSAINNYFLKGVLPEDTVNSCRDIMQFLTYQKVDKKYAVEYNDKIIQRINRYYASTNGYSLYKFVYDEGRVVQSVIVHFKDSTYKRVTKTHIEPGGAYYNNDAVSHFEYNAGWLKTDERKGKYENMLSSSGVVLANNLDEIKEFPKDINYRYYISEAKKVISQIENRQMSLF